MRHSHAQKPENGRKSATMQNLCPESPDPERDSYLILDFTSTQTDNVIKHLEAYLLQQILELV